MTPEEESDYQEAIHSIKEAEENKSVKLDLSGLEYLTRFSPKLAELTSLQSLDALSISAGRMLQNARHPPSNFGSVLAVGELSILVVNRQAQKHVIFLLSKG